MIECGISVAGKRFPAAGFFHSKICEERPAACTELGESLNEALARLDAWGA